MIFLSQLNASARRGLIIRLWKSILFLVCTTCASRRSVTPFLQSYLLAFVTCFDFSLHNQSQIKWPLFSHLLSSCDLTRHLFVSQSSTSSTSSTQHASDFQSFFIALFHQPPAGSPSTRFMQKLPVYQSQFALLLLALLELRHVEMHPINFSIQKTA